MTLRELREWAAQCPGVMHEDMRFWARVFETTYARQLRRNRSLPGCRPPRGDWDTAAWDATP
ncbi:MAG: hypothetical protein JO250_09280 [Armatimonadetes bacterium]|nr:hypothetical protein [Armatimonadota bacterium]